MELKTFSAILEELNESKRQTHGEDHTNEATDIIKKHGHGQFLDSEDGEGDYHTVHPKHVDAVKHALTKAGWKDHGAKSGHTIYADRIGDAHKFTKGGTSVHVSHGPSQHDYAHDGHHEAMVWSPKKHK